MGRQTSPPIALPSKKPRASIRQVESKTTYHNQISYTILSGKKTLKADKIRTIVLNKSKLVKLFVVDRSSQLE